MKIFFPGVWDLLHVGHIEALEFAKLMADKLIVGVPSDEVVKEDKGEYPIIPLFHRMKMLKSIWCVDGIIPYYNFEFIEPVKVADPDIVCLGNYLPQETRYQELDRYCYKNSIRIIYIPRNNNESTTEIKKRCIMSSI